ncbi:MAG: ATP-binding protein [bacterium]
MSFNLIIPLVAFGVNLFLAILVVSRNRRANNHRLFSIFLLCMALWALFTFYARSSQSPDQFVPWQKGILIAVVGASVAFMHFSYAHTRNRPKPGLLWAAYVVLVFMAAAYPTTFLVSGVGQDAFGYYAKGPLVYAVPVFGYLFFGIGVANIFRTYRKSNNYEEKNSFLYILTGVYCFLAGGVADMATIFGIPIPPLAMIGNTMFGLLATVAMLRYHLLDIRIVIRKSIEYATVSTLVAFPYVLFLFSLNFFLGSRGVPWWINAVLLLVFAASLEGLWRWGQVRVDKFFYRERYDFLLALERFSREPHDISDLRKLGTELVKLMAQALQISSAHLLLLTETKDMAVVSAYGTQTADVVIPRNSPIVRWLAITKDVLHWKDLEIIPQLQSLAVRDKQNLSAMGTELFIPLKNNKDELVGILIFGKKLSSQPYTEEDLRRIVTVASRVAIELDNARLYAQETMMRQELQRLDEQKTEFLHNVAHELKTPLTAIISSSELIGDEGLHATPEQQSRLMENINRSAWMLDRRVGELLDLARVQIGSLELKLEPHEICNVIEDMVSQTSSLFLNKKQVLLVDIPKTPPPVEIDRDRIEQVILNLLSNANKFSPAGSEINISVNTAGERIIISVEDQAKPITEDDKVRLFSTYFRGGSEEDKKRISGLGLGLAISKKIIELHHGEIWVDNKAAEGNRFCFSLPVYHGVPGPTSGFPLSQIKGDTIESTDYRG